MAGVSGRIAGDMVSINLVLRVDRPELDFAYHVVLVQNHVLVSSFGKPLVAHPLMKTQHY